MRRIPLAALPDMSAVQVMIHTTCNEPPTIIDAHVTYPIVTALPPSPVIDRVRDSTNEVGGRLIEMGGAEYMIRGLGYLRSLSDLETVPVSSKNGTPVLVRDLGSVGFGPDIRRGVAEWNGEGETVGGIVVMRYGLNALTVIDGVEKKLAEIKSSLPPGVEVVSGYDRAGLIRASINTLKRSLIE